MSNHGGGRLRSPSPNEIECEPVAERQDASHGHPMRPEFSSAKNTTDEITPTTDAPSESTRKLQSDRFLSMLLWHFWTIGSCIVITILLAFNFSSYVIGTYIGKDDRETSLILSLMLVASKAHEIMMVISLVNIAHQAIQRSLIGDGVLLGLLASKELVEKVFFIFSKGFRSALRYGLSTDPRSNNTLVLLSTIFVVSVLCTVVGPASAVLMIPELNWFFEGTFVWNNSLEPFNNYCYPYILIDPRLGGGDYGGNVSGNALFLDPVPNYWGHSMHLRNSSDDGRFELENTMITHRFQDAGTPVVVNSSTTWNRILDIDNSWAGETNFSTVFQADTDSIGYSLARYESLPKNRRSDSRFIAAMTGIRSSTVCRTRRKLSCAHTNESPGNNSDWCFFFVAPDTDHNTNLLRSQDLLMLADANDNNDSDTAEPANFWVTEGLRTRTNQKFTDSILFVFENHTDTALLTVCSTSAFLRSVKAISPDRIFAAEQLETYGNHLYYFEHPNHTSDTATERRTLLYHENWLDMIYDLSIDENSTKTPAELAATPKARNSSRVTTNEYLKTWATSIQDAPSTKGGSIEAENVLGDEAAMVEIVVGGAFISIVSRMATSYMQYSASADWFRDGSWKSTNATIRQHYPLELMPEPPLDCQYQVQPLDVYHRVYGYQTKSVPNILSMVVIMLYCVVAILGSLWQCRKGRIVTVWGDIAEYGSLCLGTEQVRTIDNARVEAGSTGTSTILVQVKEVDMKPVELVLYRPVTKKKNTLCTNIVGGVSGRGSNEPAHTENPAGPGPIKGG